MKALVYEKAHSLADFAIKLVEIPVPALRENDVLVDVRTIGVNPGEGAIRSMRSADSGDRVLLSWEFAGVVSAVGAAVARLGWSCLSTAAPRPSEIAPKSVCGA
jgi:NADPH:quinone reductase